jgi:hypothetical protein
MIQASNPAGETELLFFFCPPVMISNAVAKKKKAGGSAGLRELRPLLGFDRSFYAFGAKHNGRLPLPLPHRDPL